MVSHQKVENQSWYLYLQRLFVVIRDKFVVAITSFLTTITFKSKTTKSSKNEPRQRLAISADQNPSALHNLFGEDIEA